VITGAVFTVSAADDDVTLPHELLIKQSYEPASDTLTEAIVSVALVAPAMFEPFLRHWKVGEKPDALTLIVADWLVQASTDAGCVVMEGGLLTVSVAAEVVTVPHGLLITHSYEPASAALAAGIDKVALVAPEMFDPFLRHWKVRSEPLEMTLNEAGCPAQVVAETG
jgi:hypothetical protein